jgi:hypothetical protein
VSGLALEFTLQNVAEQYRQRHIIFQKSYYA